MNKILIYVVALLVSLSLVSAKAEFYVSVSPTSYEVGWSESKQVTVKIHCSNTMQNCRCYGKLDSGTETYFEVSAGSDVYKYPTVSAPSSPSKGSNSYTYNVRCNEYWDSSYVYDSATFTINYPTSSQWAAYQAEQQAKSSASSAISSASSLISQAQSAISSAQSKIREANNLGADIASAQGYLDQATADLSSANSYLSNANSAYSSNNYNSASNYASNAQSKANDAKSKANSALSEATHIIEEWNRKKIEAQNKISNANSEIDTAKVRIQKGESVIYNATVLGLDTASAKAGLATARTKVESAEEYHRDATSMFNTGNFEGAKDKAALAIQYANQAESTATDSYSSLEQTIAILSESSKAILSADSEISQMNQINTKLDYVIESTETWGVAAEDTKSVLITSKTSVDSAEDLLSKAKNRQTAGAFSEAVNYANQARDAAASSRNRLDTISSTLSNNIQKALSSALTKLEPGLTEAQNEVDSAGNTYGATVNDVIEAQKQLASAKKSLQQAKDYTQKVKGSLDLSDLIENADKAFKSLSDANKQIAASINKAKSAKLGMVKKVAAGAAGVAGAAGGGFLYYRYRKKKKKKGAKEEKKESKKEERKKDKKEEKEAKEQKKASKNVKKLGKRIIKGIKKGKEMKEIVSELKKEGWSPEIIKEAHHIANEMYKTKRKAKKSILSVSISKTEKPKKINKCPKCGHKIKKEKFCPECGEKIRK